MSAKNIQYRRLVRRRGVGAIQTQGLWAAEDYLLLSTLIEIHEEYRRIFFNDIQAMVWHATRRQRNLFVLCGVLAIPFVVALVMTWRDAVQPWPFGICLGLVLLGAIVNAVRGPSVSLYIQTATGTVQIACITRLHRAQRLMRLIGEQARLRQGDLTPEAWTVNPVPLIPVALPMPRLTPPPLVTTVVTERMIQVHRLAFALVCLGALFSLTMIVTNNLALVLLKTFLGLGALLSCVGGLVRARRLPFGGRLAAIHAGALIYFVLLALATYVGIIAVSVQVGARHTDADWTILHKFTGYSGADSPALLILFIVMGCVELLIGCLGFGVLNELRGQWAALAAGKTATPAPPPLPSGDSV